MARENFDYILLRGDICHVTGAKNIYNLLCFSVVRLIRHNKKDGGMLIVKTVLCEFALAAYNDS